jgi:hypothetical protein
MIDIKALLVYLSWMKRYHHEELIPSTCYPFDDDFDSHRIDEILCKVENPDD